MRWRYGETNPVIGQVPQNICVEIGDLVYYESDSVKPAGVYSNQSSKALTQSGYANMFLGVAMQRSPLEESTTIRIATSGVFEYEINAGTFVLGANIGIEEYSDRTGIENQKVSTSNTDGAIGKIVRREPVASDSVYVKIKSRVID